MSKCLNKRKAFPSGVKKSSMKTAEQVINRILWDEKIPQAEITIGYLDRFLGIVEKPFASFSWEPLDSIDYYTFAVPKHRIQYFKYKNLIIWDKRKRLDKVFGSIGSGITIEEIIRNYDDSFSSDNKADPKHYSSVSDDESDIDVYLDETKVTAFNDSCESDDDDQYWRNKLRPNFFICQRISDENIINNARVVQEAVVSREPLYDTCCHPPNMLHMTFCTLRLDDAAQVSDCVEILKQAKEELNYLLPKDPLKVCGVDRFFGRVLYAKVEHTNELTLFVDHLRLVLHSRGFRIADNFDFVAHISLIKVTRPVSRKLGKCDIDPALFQGFEDLHFGTQTLDNIYLCSMEKSRDTDGFYISPANMTFMKSLIIKEGTDIKDF
ncbi:unnamed protein product [Protopolystoma xenopodis]|uniref:Leukocyte receptor cluster member 9 n=1 Tax=Protopolystoma xenopodis TaxID=117903 RepID=A0A3S5BIA9_9PLAT|nr:unnamed protein product [Protopolystoma xenopodis]